MVVGMSGTRRGMTDAQKTVFMRMLLEHKATILHHGDCNGADAEAHAMAKRLGLGIETHPCASYERAYCEGATKEHPVYPPLIRNLHIIGASDLMIATPAQTTPQMRGSGTWHVIRHTPKQKKPLIIIWPDGSTEAR